MPSLSYRTGVTPIASLRRKLRPTGLGGLAIPLNHTDVASDVDCVGARRPKSGMRGMDDLSGTLKVWDGRHFPRGNAPMPYSRPTIRWCSPALRAEAFLGMDTPGRRGRAVLLAMVFGNREQAAQAAWRWIPVAGFAKHSGEKLLGWATASELDSICPARPDIVVCCPHAEQLNLIQRNFNLRLSGRFLTSARLPTRTECFDRRGLCQRPARSLDRTTRGEIIAS